ACALVRTSQSNCAISAIARSRGSESSGSANDISGSNVGIAPHAESSFASASLCAADRVITMRFLASELGEFSATLPAHFFEDGLRTCFNEQARHVLAELCGLVRWRRRALFHILQTVHGTNACIHHELAPFDARPCAHRYLAPVVKRRKE